MRTCWLRLLPWLALAATILVLPGDAIILLTFASWAVFLLTFAAVASARISPTGGRGKPVGGPVHGAGWANVGVLAGLVVGQVLLSWAVLAAVRESATAPISASNLRGIAFAIEQYCKTYGQPPASLTALVLSGESTAGQVVGLDDVQEGFTNGEVNTSYVYLPHPDGCTADPRRVVAYEREVCAPMACAVLFRRYGRWVLFGDGRVERMAEAEFREALRGSNGGGAP